MISSLSIHQSDGSFPWRLTHRLLTPEKTTEPKESNLATDAKHPHSRVQQTHWRLAHCALTPKFHKPQASRLVQSIVTPEYTLVADTPSRHSTIPRTAELKSGESTDAKHPQSEHILHFGDWRKRPHSRIQRSPIWRLMQSTFAPAYSLPSGVETGDSRTRPRPRLSSESTLATDANHPHSRVQLTP